jgi:hypothetical protein
LGKVISLGKARKARQREQARAQADANAIRHGRTKAERAQQALQERQQAAILDGARRGNEATSDAADADDVAEAGAGTSTDGADDPPT